MSLTRFVGLGVACALVLGWGAHHAQAVVPGMFSYQGLVTESDGTPTTGPVNLTIRLYGGASGGAALYTESHTGVELINGVFSIHVGSVQPLAEALWDTPQVWLGVSVNGGTELTPRTRLVAVPYAARAGRADDATTLQSLTAAQFLRSDTADAFTGEQLLIDAGSIFAARGPVVLGDALNANPSDLHNVLNLLVGSSANGSINGLTFHENTPFTLGMSIGYDGTPLDTRKAIRFYNASHQPVMTIETGGNVGVGRTDPQAKLHVGGDILIDGLIRTASTDVSVSIGPESFRPTRHDTQYEINLFNLQGALPGQPVVFVAPVKLPDGAVVRRFEAFVIDDDAAGDMTVTLRRTIFGSATTTSMATVTTTGAAASMQEPLALTINDPTVDNVTRTYSIRAEWTTPTPTSKMRLFAARIRYRIDRISP